jgi:hypothetical protein
MGVVFERPPKAPFVERLGALRRDFMADPELAGMIAEVDKA